MTNPHRGEVEFNVGDIQFTARPNFKLIAAIELECNASILVLAGRVRTGQLKFSETIAITTAAARLCEKPPVGATKSDFVDRLFDAGVVNWLVPVSKLLGEAISVGSGTKNAEGGAGQSSSNSPGSDTSVSGSAG